MIFEVSFALVGGVNLRLEKSWKIVEGIMALYPHATWRRIIGKKKGKYIIEVA